MLESSAVRQAVYFAVPVLIAVEVANFPFLINFSSPAYGWKVMAFAVSLVNLLVCLSAFASGLLVLLVLRARVISVVTLVVAGVLSGVELMQFAPFAYPLAFPVFVLACGLLASLIPMSITLFLLAYMFSRRKDPTSIDPLR